MSLEIAMEELRTRKAEEAEAERIGTIDTWRDMKRRRGLRRRKVIGWPRSRMNAWLAIAAAQQAGGDAGGDADDLKRGAT